MVAQHKWDRLRKKEKDYARLENAMQKLQDEKEERERTSDDYETCISNIKNNYKFNHEYGDWYDNKKGDARR